MGRRDDLPWTHQWHVTADGTVIQQRSRGDEPHQQLFQAWSTTRPTTRPTTGPTTGPAAGPVTVAQVEELQERLRRRSRRAGVVGCGTLLVLLAVFVAAGGLFTHRVSGEVLPGLVVGAVVGLVVLGVGFELVLGLLVRFGPRHSVGAEERMWHELGLASAGVTMKGAEARALIAAPGSQSGRVVRAER